LKANHNRLEGIDRNGNAPVGNDWPGRTSLMIGR